MKRATIIEVKDLVGKYAEETVLDHISFNVYEGEIFVILGRSGCGKTTLLKHLIGLIPPSSGQILINGIDITHCDEKTFKKILRTFGVLYQNTALISSMTLAENVALPIKEHTNIPKNSINDLVKMKLASFDLDGYENYLPSEISGGMRKRAGLVRAMALNPQILFFDEPSSGLDPVTSAELDNLIIQINKSLGTTMIIVTHELHSIFALAQRVIMLDSRTKTIIAEGTPEDLRDHSQNEAVRHFFNRQPENKMRI